jgi:hypothetical protein
MPSKLASIGGCLRLIWRIGPQACAARTPFSDHCFNRIVIFMSDKQFGVVKYDTRRFLLPVRVRHYSSKHKIGNHQMLNPDRISWIASQLALRPDQRKALHEHLKPYIKTDAPAAINAASAAESRRLAKFDAVAASGSLEMRNLTLELNRLQIPYSREAGLDPAELRRVADARGLDASKRIQLLSAAALVGLIAD